MEFTNNNGIHSSAKGKPLNIGGGSLKAIYLFTTDSMGFFVIDVPRPNEGVVRHRFPEFVFVVVIICHP